MQGIKVQFDAQSIQQLKSQFSQFINDLDKQGKINVQVDTQSLAKIKGSLDEIQVAYEKIGKTKIIPEKFDSNGELKNFTVQLEQVDGLLQKISYRASEFKDVNGMLQPTGFSVTGITQIDKTTEAMQKQEQEAQKLADAIAKVHEQSDINVKQRDIDLENEYNKSLEQEELEYQKIQGAIAKTIAKREEENQVLEENQAKAINKNLEQEYQSQMKEASRVSGLGEVQGVFSPELLSQSDAEVKKYISSLYGLNAEVVTLTRSYSAEGTEMVKATVNVKEHGSEVSQESIILDANTNSVYKNSSAVKELGESHNSLANRLSNAVQSFLSFTVVMGGFYEVIHQVRDAFDFNITLDTKLSDIAMIVGESKSTLQQYAQQWNQVAINMKVATDQVIDSNEAFMRAGKSIDESNKLTETNIKLSRVSGEEAGSMAEDLVKLSNAYNLSADQVEKYANKVAYLDSATAANSKGINAATIYAAETAQSTGMSLDYLMSIVTTIEENSKKGSEAVGRSVKSILLNIEKIQQTDLSAPVSKLEKTLNNQGIALRANEHEWRSSEDVLKDIMKAWGNMDSVTKSTVTQYIAGKNQAEEFMTIMNKSARVQENYNNALSATNNLNEKYQQHLDSVQGSLNEFTATLQKFYMSLGTNKVLITFIDEGTQLVKVLELLTSTAKDSGIELIALGTSLVLAIKNFNAINVIMPDLLANLKTLGLVIKTGITDSLVALATPAGMIITLIAAATYVIVENIRHEKELKDETDNLTKSYQQLTQAIKDNNNESMKNESSTIKKAQDELQQLLDKRKELEEQLKNTNSNDLIQDPTGLTTDFISKQSELQTELDSTNKAISEQEQVLKDAGITFSDTTGEIYKLSDAEQLIKVNDAVKQIKDEAQAHKDNDQTMLDLINRYGQLNNIQNKSAAQQKELSNVAQELNDRNKDFTISVDKNGNAIITNTALLGKQKDALELDIQTTNANTQAKINNAVNSMKMEYNNTTYTISEVEARIKAYQAETEALQQTELAKKGMLDMTYVPADIQKMFEWYGGVSDAINKIKNDASAITTSAPVISGGDSSDNSFFGDASSSSSTKSKGTTINPQDPYTNEIASNNEELTKAEKNLTNLDNAQKQYASNKDYQNALKTNNELLQQESDYQDLLKAKLTETSTMKSNLAKELNNLGITNSDMTSPSQLQAIYDARYANRELTNDQKTQADNLKRIIDEWNSVNTQMDNINSKLDSSNTKIQDINNNIQQTIQEQQSAIAQGVDNLKSLITDALKEEYTQEENNAEKALNTQMDNIDKEKQAKLDAIDAEIAALDQQTQAESDAMAIANQQNQIANATDPLQKFALEQQLIKMQKDIDTRNQKQSLEDQKTTLSTEYDNQKQALQDQLDAIKQFYSDKLDSANLDAEAEKMLVDSNQTDIINLLNTYTPKWYESGKSFGEQMIQGLNDSNIQATINNMLSALSQARAMAGYSGSSSSSVPSSVSNPISGAQYTDLGGGSYTVHFAEGGETNRTGLHWLDGKQGSPERVLSAEQTASFDKLVSYLPSLMPSIKIPQLNSNNSSTSNQNNYQVSLNVDMSKVSDVQKLISVINGIPQSVKKGVN